MVDEMLRLIGGATIAACCCGSSGRFPGGGLRSWMNQHFYQRRGVSFLELTEAQREAGIGLLRAGLSARGLTLTRDIMRLNHTLGELNGDRSS